MLQLGLLAFFVIVSAKAQQPQPIVTIMYSFSGTDGFNPDASLFQGRDGCLYGTTMAGGQYYAPEDGEYGDGTVFKMTLSGAFTSLFSFDNTNGYYPQGPVMQGSDGNLYGTTQTAGTLPNGNPGYGYGTVFSMTTNGVLNYSVALAGTNGNGINSGLVQGLDGNFYGVAYGGGWAGYVSGQIEKSQDGTVFRVTPSGALTAIFTFDQLGSHSVGIYPSGGLVQGPDGTLYGTTAMTIYKITTNGAAALLFNLNGSGPTGPLVWGANGNLFGVTTSGGTWGWGSVFQVSTNETFTNIFSFDGTNGSVQNYGADNFDFAGGLVLGSDGNFYAATVCGGPGFNQDVNYEGGTLYQITPGGTFTSLYAFGNVPYDGFHPAGGLIQASDGNFYGVTFDGGTNTIGSIFRLSMPLPPVFKSVLQANGSTLLTWSAVGTRAYQLQFTTNLAAPNWTSIGGQITATNDMLCESDTSPSDAQRFYRVEMVR